MSKKHPVIAVTGSSGAGTTTVKRAFEHIFRREKLEPAIVEGDSFHSLDRKAFKEAVAKAEKAGKRAPSHFGPEANHFDKIEQMFRDYGEKGVCQRRYYLHNDEEAAPYKQEAGTFTPWKAITKGSDLLFYEGLHGGVVTDKVDVASPAGCSLRKAQSATLLSNPAGALMGMASWPCASATSTTACPPKLRCNAATPSSATCRLNSAADKSRVSSNNDCARRSRLLEIRA